MLAFNLLSPKYDPPPAEGRPLLADMMDLLKTTLTDTDKLKAFGLKYENDPVGFCKDIISWREGEALSSYQEDIMNGLVLDGRLAVRSLHGTGKAQPHGLIIDTPDGPRMFGDLTPGCRVFGSDGAPITVVAVYERGEMETLRVVFSDGSNTICTADHLWTVRRSGVIRPVGAAEWETLSLGELLGIGLDRPNGPVRARRWAIPTVAPLVYPPRLVPVDPYTLGAWLGDGTGKRGMISGRDREVPDRIRAAGYRVGERVARTSLEWQVYGLRPMLRKLGVLGRKPREKAVPYIYLYNDPEVRREVLRGLLDTDGTVDKRGLISFCSTSEQLALDVAWLARSLGGVARVHRKTNRFGPFWVVALTLPEGRWFYIERKQGRVKPTSQDRYLRRWIDRVEPVGREPVRCIQVDAPNGLYVANDAILTHNTCTAALLILWFALTRDALGKDWKCVTTASVERQLIRFLWPEVKKWARRVRWKEVGRPPWSRSEFSGTMIKSWGGQAFYVVCQNSAAIEGAHAEELFYLFDEAKTIPGPTWGAAEGAFSNAGAQGYRALFLAESTPEETDLPSGQFYEIFTKRAKYAAWSIYHVTLAQALAAGRVSQQWVDERKTEWGEESAIYRAKVLGDFSEGSLSSVVPLAWVLAAQERWRKWVGAGRPAPKGRLSIGLDVADGGADLSLYARFWSDLGITDILNVSVPQLAPGAPTTMMLVGKITPLLHADQPDSFTGDANGVGSGVVGRVEEMASTGRLPIGTIFPFKGSMSAMTPDGVPLTDASGYHYFRNARSAAYYGMRERLDPETGSNMMLPDIPELAEELSAPVWTYSGSDIIVVESRELVMERLGRSLNYSDVVVMACFSPTTQIRVRSL